MKKTIISLVSIAGLAVGLYAQTPAAAPAAAQAQKNQKNWKDNAEYELYSAIIKPDATPAVRLQNLDKWKSAYPQSEYADTRQKIYLLTYQALNNHRAAFDMATEILKTDPNDLASIQEILGYVRALEPADVKAPLSAQNKADLETAEKVSRYLLANSDAIFAADKKPAGATDAQWAQAKPTMEKFAQFTLGYIGVEEKDAAKAEAELIKDLQTDPTNAQASYMLATLLLGQQKEHPEKMPFALFEYARAAVYDGPGAMDAKTRGTVDNFLTTKAYPTYHGSTEGLPELKTLAKTNALPPADHKIKSTVDIAKEDEEKRQAAAKDNPMLAFWTTMKESLTSADSAVSDKYWEAAKGAGLPPKESVPTGKFKGKLISATPETRPKELLIAIEKPDVADAKLVLEEPLPGKMEPGGDISFFGSPEEFSKSPYMVTFKIVDPKDDIEGWTGKGPAGPPRTGAKKAPAKKQP
jgi:tetratricopeptide (TPR) repeat protein